jgi:long-chain acyl-CoA synthetase
VNLAQFLIRSARVFPQAPAVALGERLLYDYREFARRAGSLASGLVGRFGLCRGDRVALFMDNCPAYLEALYGIWWAGLAAVPINAKLHAREAEYILNASEVKLCFVDEKHGNVDGDALFCSVDVGSQDYTKLLRGTPLEPVDVAPDALAWLFYTSGTTGRPKGAMLSHRNFLTMTACYFMDVDTVEPRDSTLYAAPMSHGAGCYNFMFVQRAALHVVPHHGFEPAEVLALAKYYAPVPMSSEENGGARAGMSLFAAPTMVKRLVEYAATTGFGAHGIKTIVYGGGPMYAEDIKQALAAMGDRFAQIYGQGESPMTITVLPRRILGDRAHPRWEVRIGSVGIAQSLVDVCVVDADGKPLPAGETGEVVVRGDVVMSGYWRDPEATAKALRDGWLWTGDMGAFDTDGFLTLKDRSKDVIISGGSNVYPREVEEVLLRHPKVREASVVGRPDPEWGEVVVAFVVGEEVAADELDKLCLNHIARFKRPKEYRLIDSLPKNNYGKVLKTALRELLKA